MDFLYTSMGPRKGGARQDGDLSAAARMTGCDDIPGLEVQGTEVTTGDCKNGPTPVGVRTKAKPERRRIQVELKEWGS